jgi:hypothetical protein
MGPLSSRITLYSWTTSRAEDGHICLCAEGCGRSWTRALGVHTAQESRHRAGWGQVERAGGARDPISNKQTSQVRPHGGKARAQTPSRDSVPHRTKSTAPAAPEAPLKSCPLSAKWLFHSIMAKPHPEKITMGS